MGRASGRNGPTAATKSSAKALKRGSKGLLGRTTMTGRPLLLAAALLTMGLVAAAPATAAQEIDGTDVDIRGVEDPSLDGTGELRDGLEDVSREADEWIADIEAWIAERCTEEASGIDQICAFLVEVGEGVALLVLEPVTEEADRTLDAGESVFVGFVGGLLDAYCHGEEQVLSEAQDGLVEAEEEQKHIGHKLVIPVAILEHESGEELVDPPSSLPAKGERNEAVEDAIDDAQGVPIMGYCDVGPNAEQLWHPVTLVR